MSNFIVGLTGGIGSGKSTVADAFVALGAALVDTDAIAHELTAPGGDAMPAIVADFGAEIAEADGRLNRAMMRQRVFADPSARKRLEAILHPLIRQRATAQCQAATAPYVILAVPLLIESGAWQERCDRVLVVDCQESAQISRVMARSALAEKDVRAILATQASRAERLAVADDVIDNDGSQDVLAAQVGALHRSYLQLAGKKLHANR